MLTAIGAPAGGGAAAIRAARGVTHRPSRRCARRDPAPRIWTSQNVPSTD